VCEELGQRRRSYIVWWFLAMAELPVSKKYILISSLHQQLPGQTAAADLGLHHFSGSPVLLLLLLLLLFLQAFIRPLCNLVQYSEFISLPPPQNIHFCILDTAGAFLLLDHHESLNSKSHVMINAALQSTFS